GGTCPWVPDTPYRWSSPASASGWLRVLDARPALAPPPPVSPAAARTQGAPAGWVTSPTAAGHRRNAVGRPCPPGPCSRVHREACLGGRLTPAKDTRLLRAGAFSGTVPHEDFRSSLCAAAAVSC